MDLHSPYQNVSVKFNNNQLVPITVQSNNIWLQTPLDLSNEINQKNPISSIISKKTFIPEYQNLFLQIQEIYTLDLLPDYFLSTDKYLQPAKRFFQYWNKIKKSLKY